MKSMILSLSLKREGERERILFFVEYIFDLVLGDVLNFLPLWIFFSWGLFLNVVTQQIFNGAINKYCRISSSLNFQI